MRQSNKCESVGIDEIFNLKKDLMQALLSAYSVSSKTPTTFIDSIRPNM